MAPSLAVQEYASPSEKQKNKDQSKTRVNTNSGGPERTKLTNQQTMAAFATTTTRILLVLGMLLWHLPPQASGREPRQPQRQQTSFQDQCANFLTSEQATSSARASNATVTNHAFVAAGSNISLPGADVSCGLASQVIEVDLCRVSVEIATSNRSSVLAEIWMPADWNGRLVTTGNGGLGGC